MKFQFGQKIKVKGWIIRIKEGNRRFWRSYPFVNEMDGIFLKHITLSNGKTEYQNYGEEGVETIFSPGDYLKGAWVCIRGRSPMKVLLEDIEG